MNVIKKIMLPAMLGFVASGLMGTLSHATVLSDLQAQCLPCHDVTISPINWVLSLGAAGTPAGIVTAQKTLSGWQTTIAAMGDGKCGFITIGPGGTSRYVAAQFLYGMPPITPTFTVTPTPTFTPTPTVTPTATPTVCVCASASPTATPTFTPIGDPHPWYDYDYQGGRCFAKDHSIMDIKWCEQHGMKGGGTHSSLTGYNRHAHLDFPGQKP